MNRVSEKGFTLIELLVVIAIIGMLSAIILASLNQARSKSRDAERLEEIHQIQTALELYYNANGQYPPSTNGAVDPNGSWSNSAEPATWSPLQTALQPYIPTLPTDPINADVFEGESFDYFSSGYGCNQQWYMLVYSLENASGPDTGVSPCSGNGPVPGLFKYGGAGANTTIKTVGVSGLSYTP